MWMPLIMTKLELPIMIKLNNLDFINPERVAILRLIASGGSLFFASKELSISYQKAWSVVDDMNKKAPSPLVTKQRGGSNGGGAAITEYGSNILKEYSYIEQLVLDFTKRLNHELNL